MNYLFIDASETRTWVQSAKANKFFNQEFETNRNLGAKLTQICDEMLQKVDLKKNEIDLFAVCTGPGSLTGLRVANAFLRTLAYLSGKPLAGIDLFSWTAATLRAAGTNGPIRLMTPTLIDKAFAVDIDLSRPHEDYRPEPVLLDNRLPSSERPTFGIRWQAEGIIPCEPSAQVLHQLLQNSAPAAGFADLLQVLPLYIIPSQAERKLEERQC